VLDEEHELGARITLERKRFRRLFAITCGIYGWMVHTHCSGYESEAPATYEKMKLDLDSNTRSHSRADDPDVRSKSSVVSTHIAQFVEQYR
jgi:hypothetical protein